MRLLNSRLLARAVACVALVAMAASATLSVAAHTAGGTPNWLVNNAKTKTATLTIIAGYKGGFDFNGYGMGKLTVTVPVGYHVNVVFSNNAATMHSLVFTATKPASTAFTVAFKGAASPKPTSGVGKGTTQKFSFVADKVGTYSMVCAVPGHALAGMWDVFKVVKSGSPTINPSR